MKSRKKKKMSLKGILKRVGVALSLLIPPLGIYLVWRTRWSTALKYALTVVSVGIAVAYIAFIPSQDTTLGGVQLVGAEKNAEIYGPELPTAMVTGYTTSLGDPVIAPTDDASTTVEYVYANMNSHRYHRYECKFAYASSEKLTLYEAYYLGCTPCNLCKPPVYDPSGDNK